MLTAGTHGPCTAVPWGKVFKAIKVGVEAFKVWRSLDRAYTAVKDAEQAAKLAEDAVKAEHAVAEARKAESAGSGATEDAACAVHSFVPGTGVRLADGSSKPISTVKAGDTVLATDPQTGVTAPEKVQNVIVTTTDKDFTTLTLDTAPVRGPPQHGKTDVQTLTTTWHHPFWDATHQRWTDAHQLTAGTELRQPDGTTVCICGVRNFHQHSTTYDLTVGTLHTYYVLAGGTPLLVHNCPTGGAADLPDFDPSGMPRHQPGAAASRSGEASAEALAEEGAQAAEFKSGAVEELATVAQNVGDHIGGGTPVSDPVTAVAVAVTVGIDAFKKGAARRAARRAAEGGR
ncbi:polymorphic toxin-type HINT domain-containing protein [Streptomyces sp. NPDC055681]